MITLDHKSRFKSSSHAKAWGQVTASETYVEAVNAAMLVMLSQQKPDAECSTRLEGARHFLGILSNLTTEIPTPKIENQNLKTNV